MFNKRKKVLFCTGMVIILVVSIWFFFFQHKVLREEFEELTAISGAPIVEHMDPNQNMSVEPDKSMKDPGKDKNKTGLYLQSSDPTAIQEWGIALVNNALQLSTNNQARGPPGQQGQRGAPGKNGGLYVSQGPLRSVYEPGLVVERTYGMGPGARCFLSGQTWLPQQTWNLDKDNKICSQYNTNECITLNEDGSEAHIGPRLNSVAFNHIPQTGQIRTIRPIDGKNKCLSIKKMGSISANHVIKPGEKASGPSKPLIDKMILIAEDCDQGKMQQRWAFH